MRNLIHLTSVSEEHYEQSLKKVDTEKLFATQLTQQISKEKINLRYRNTGKVYAQVVHKRHKCPTYKLTSIIIRSVKIQ